MNLRCLPFLPVLLGLTGMASAATVSPQPNLPVTTRGQSVVVYGDGFPNAPITVYLRTGKEEKGDRGYQLPGVAGADQKSVTFKLPDDAPTGDYLVFLDFDSNELAVPGELRIVPDASAKVTLDSIAPATDYSNPDSNSFEFVIAGQNLAHQASDNTLIVVGYGPAQAGSESECAAWREAKKYDKVCLSYDPGMEGQKLKISGYHPGRYEGPASFEIKVGNNISNPQKITFSGMRAETLRFAAILVFCVLAALVFLLVLRGIRLSRLAGEETGPLAAFFLDRQSNSFSLSKFQLLAWTSVAVFGYVYLFFCRMYIQWTFSFPPIPENLPTLLGVSVGTTVAAVGITVNRGSKGSGPLHPSMADFISTGGVVAGERFQFFIWTLVGCMGFLGIILSTDPASLAQLPDVPTAFLTLMGISSAGYLTGKFVRQPGPIIELLTILEVIPEAAGNPAVIRIEVKGENLSDAAIVKVDKEELRMDQFTVKGLTKQDQPSGTSFYSKLEIDLLDATEHLAGSHLLFLVNGDGQSACESFPLNALSLDDVLPIDSSDAPVDLVLVGSNFAAGLHGMWIDAAKVHHTIPDDNIQFVDKNHLKVTLTPGAAGTGKLILETAMHLLGIAEITVRKSS
ncbi:MAG TPA: hypothetical protein VMQ56_17455 [Terracidiphilus sp.]|nr:hypothetical protein [Terracidiphilus sp.]